MANNEDTYTDEWYLSNTIDRFLSEDLYLTPSFINIL